MRFQLAGFIQSEERLQIRSTTPMSKQHHTSIENAPRLVCIPLPRPPSKHHDCEACLPTFLPMLFSWMRLRKVTIRILLFLSIQKNIHVPLCMACNALHSWSIFYRGWWVLFRQWTVVWCSLDFPQNRSTF